VGCRPARIDLGGDRVDQRRVPCQHRQRIQDRDGVTLRAVAPLLEVVRHLVQGTLGAAELDVRHAATDRSG
jgi:hypothetical protein